MCSALEDRSSVLYFLTREDHFCSLLFERGCDARQICVCLGNNNSGGGSFNVQVEDNGSGISWTDFQLVCERYCTARRGSAEDGRMVRCQSYGQRGEVVLLTVTAVKPICFRRQRCFLGAMAANLAALVDAQYPAAYYGWDARN